jgi:drug/metabolite transporter (DMT)-like permease
LNSSSHSTPPRSKGILLVLAATACWGTSGLFIFNITGRSDLSAVGLAFWRDLFSTAILLAGILIIKPSLLRIKLQDLPWLLGMGVISIGTFHIFWNQAVLSLGASLATVIQCNAPVFVTILARVFFREPLTGKKILAILAAAGGTVLAAGLLRRGGWSVDTWGITSAVISALTYGSLSLFGKKLTADYNPWTITLYIFAIGTLAIWIYQGGRPEPWPAGSGVLVWLLGFVLMSTILGFGVYTRALRILPASIASIAATTEIIFATIMAVAFLGERPSWQQFLGGLLIILGVVLVSSSSSQPRDPDLTSGTQAGEI